MFTASLPDKMESKKEVKNKEEEEEEVKEEERLSSKEYIRLINNPIFQKLKNIKKN